MQWVSVEDRMPSEDDGLEFLVYLESGRYLVAGLTDDEEFLFDYNGQRHRPRVTHWSKLPPPPKLKRNH